jgi:reactive intermediate/imine deaminase
MTSASHPSTPSSTTESAKKHIVSTTAAPAAIGPYSQAVKVQHQLHQVVYTSGQIGLDPKTAELVAGGIETQARQAFANLAAVAKEAGGSLANAVKLVLFLTDLADFARVNAIMAELVPEPFPARSTIGVASLPKGALFEVEAILVI